MKGLILTCKHHDGFCLWPSKYTKHSVASSPFRNGKGDVVREVSDACRKYGIKFGVYLSPWDRNCELYGKGKAYDDYFLHQLTELLTEYGEIFSVWFDGACGEGPNGKKQYYDWDRYYARIRELQPGACISVCGPDVRWCGNEAGYTRTAEWSVVPERVKDSEIIAEKSQHRDGEEFRIPPTREGLFHEKDVKILGELGQYLERAFAVNLLEQATLSAAGTGIEGIRTDSYQEYFTGQNDTETVICASWTAPVKWSDTLSDRHDWA